jgi:hypothetical protein
VLNTSPGRGGREEELGTTGAAIGMGASPTRMFSVGVVMERERTLSQSGDWKGRKQEDNVQTL